LIAGEALMGLIKAGVVMATDKPLASMFHFFAEPPLAVGLIVLVLLAVYMIRMPLSRAGSPDEPAPPTAIM